MNRSPRNRAQRFLPLIALGALVLASCQSSFDARDKAFSRATQQRLSKNFQEQIATLSAAEKQLAGAGKEAKIPAGFKPWWQKDVSAKLFQNSKPAKQALDNLFARAMANSSQIRVFSDLPLIRETGIQEARGEFDHHLFVETSYAHVNEPVGSTLTTGGPDRFRQWEHVLEAGVRRKLVTGADVQLSQRLARTSNNSEFFVPDKQASAVLALTVVQPLLRGAGCEYNRSLIRIAKFDSEIAQKEFVRQAEAHLLQISRAFWTLQLSRALCIQKQKLLADTAALVTKIEGRKDLDAMEGELQRARAALATRRADLVRTEMGIKNAEDRIKALINDPTFMASTSDELLPAGSPNLAEFKVDMKQAASTALENRPEIAQAFLQLRTAAVRKNMSKNELLPQLDLIMETSIAGLDNAGRLTDGWDNQWHNSHPGFLIGLRLDMPVENNVAEARLQRRRLEMRQQLAQVQTTVDTVLLEVKIAARELTTSYREVTSRYESLQATQEDLRVLQKRWESHAGTQNKPAIGYLQLLLDAQDRLAEAEGNFSRSTAVYNVAMVNLQRAQGTLLKYENIQATRTTDDETGLPVMTLEKTAPAAPPETAGKAKG